MKHKVKILSVFLLVVLLLCGCRSKADVSHYETDYGHSDLYSKQDMDSAIQTIIKEFKTWEGCTLYTISYTNDTDSKHELDYCNQLKENADFDECIIFESSFHSPVDSAKAGSFNPDNVYTGWKWILARSHGSSWTLVSWGYA